jgi:hypothetical protein
LVHYTGIKVGVTNGYICLALLKQIWVIADLLPSVLTQAISDLFVAQPTGMPSATTITQAKVCRRRLFMRYP